MKWTNGHAFARWWNNKINWLLIFDILALTLLVLLGIEVLPTLQRDNWGYDSWYMHKLLLVCLTIFSVRNYWLILKMKQEMRA